jgi:hypothetical protein
MAKVWIRNNHISSVIVHYFTEEGKEKIKHDVRLNVERLDRITGLPVHNGYTAIDKEEFEKLYEQSSVFKSNVDSGLFVRFDTPPEDAFTESQRLSMLETEKQRLIEELNTYRSTHHVSDEEVTALQARLNELHSSKGKSTDAPEGDGSAEFAGG